MWLRNSSVGRKVVMSLSGFALVLFLTFHACMNLVALFSADAYNAICAFLGANWYAVVATMGLGVLMAVHFIYAIILTAQNMKARGTSKYAVVDTPKSVEWSSQNMMVLGVIIVLGLMLHLYNFWYNMMFVELAHKFGCHLEPLLVDKAADGYYWITQTFSNPVFSILYLVWFAALWFHLSHGIWSSMQSLGLSGKIWFPRVKKISYWYSTILMLMYAVVVLRFWLFPACCGASCGA